MAKQNMQFSERFRTPKGRFCFTYFEEPWTPEGESEDKAVYKTGLIIPIADFQPVEDFVNAFVKQAFPNKEYVKRPWSLGDEMVEQWGEHFAGTFVLNMKNKKQPDFVDAKKKVLTAEDVYAGSYGKAIVTFASYVMAGNPGITCYLKAVQKIADGERFAGGSATSDFDIEDNEAANNVSMF